MNKKNFVYRKINTALAAGLIVATTIPFGNIYALVNQSFLSDNNILFYDPSAPGLCAATAPPTVGALSNNIPVATAVSGAEKYKSLYEKVGQQKDVPWQMLAAIHYRETNYGNVNPSNGQGIFQFYSLTRQGQTFPPGPVSDQELERQLGLMADILRGMASSTPISNLKNVVLTYGGNNNARKVKDVFFSYNGRSPKYAQQAAGLGFDPSLDPFEGSPYVMNLYDDKHVPMNNPSGWGGFYADGQFGYYPQYNSRQAGAFVVYAALGGESIGGGGSCNSVSMTGNNIVDTARKELAKNISEKPPGCDDGNPMIAGDCGDEINKYTDNRLEYWCADFVSWVYKTAGVSFSGGLSGGWRIAGTGTMRTWFENPNNGVFFEKDDERAPKPGDVVFFNYSGQGHVGIVDSVNGDSIITIEGNTSTELSNNGSGVGTHTYNYKTHPNIGGFGSLDRGVSGD